MWQPWVALKTKHVEVWCNIKDYRYICMDSQVLPLSCVSCCSNDKDNLKMVHACMIQKLFCSCAQLKVLLTAGIYTMYKLQISLMHIVQ